MQKSKLFAAVASMMGAAFGATTGSTPFYGGGNQRSRMIRDHKGAFAKCGSTKYIDHAKVRQLRMECAAHNEHLADLKQAGILSRAGNVKEGMLPAYNNFIAAQAKKINLA